MLLFFGHFPYVVYRNILQARNDGYILRAVRIMFIFYYYYS